MSNQIHIYYNGLVSGIIYIYIQSGKHLYFLKQFAGPGGVTTCQARERGHWKRMASRNREDIDAQVNIFVGEINRMEIVKRSLHVRA